MFSYTYDYLTTPRSKCEMTGWSARPYGTVSSRTRSPNKQNKISRSATKSQTPNPPSSAPPQDLPQLSDAERVQNAVKQTTAEVIPNCGYFTKDELRKAIKKRLKQLDIGKDNLPSAVEKALAGMSLKARVTTMQPNRERVINTLSKLLLKQYEGLIQTNRDLSAGLDDLTSCVLVDNWMGEGEEEEEYGGGRASRKYKSSEFHSGMERLEGIKCEGERVSLQMRELTDVMEQCVFDLERNIHQQNLYLSLP